MGGIVDFDVCFPSAMADIQEMHRASGVAVADIARITHAHGFPVLGEHENAWESALRAARTVLDRSGIERRDIRQVIYAGSGEWDAPFWSPAAKVAQQLGIDEAHCFEIMNFCNAGMTALWLASESNALGPDEYVLVLIGDRLSKMVDYGDPDSKALFNFGDAAAAVLLAHHDCRFRLLHSAMRTDPSWADYYMGRIEEGRVVIRRGEHRRGLADAYVKQFTDLVGETLTALGKDISEVDHFLINQGDRSMHERLLDLLGIPPERSVFNYDRLGHMGGADTLIALQDLIAADRIRVGDLILLATSAMGFSWGITAVEFQG